MSRKNVESHNTLIIFDFDGTIANSLKLIKNIIRNSTLFDKTSIYKFERLDLKNTPAKQVIETLGVQNRLEEYENYIKEEFGKNIQSLKPIKNIDKVLKRLGRVDILTSNSKKNACAFFDQNNLTTYIRHTVEVRPLFNKTAILQKITMENPNKVIYYVGDEPRDIIAAKNSKVTAIGVTWGFSSKKLLIKSKPDFIVEEPLNLLDIFI